MKQNQNEKQLKKESENGNGHNIRVFCWVVNSIQILSKFFKTNFQINHKRTLDMSSYLAKNTSEIDSGKEPIKRKLSEEFKIPKIHKKPKPPETISINPDSNERSALFSEMEDIAVIGTQNIENNQTIPAQNPDLISDDIHGLYSRVVDIAGIDNFHSNEINQF